MLYVVRSAQPAVHPAQKRPKKSPHVQHAAVAFDRACQLGGRSGAALCRGISPALGKSNVLSRQTLAAWRGGSRLVPLAAFLAACELAGLKPSTVFAVAENSVQA